MDPRTCAIVIFVVVVAANLGGLIVDNTLAINNCPTISHYVWRHWWIGVPVILLQVVGMVALAYHFWGPA